MGWLNDGVDKCHTHTTFPSPLPTPPLTIASSPPHHHPLTTTPHTPGFVKLQPNGLKAAAAISPALGAALLRVGLPEKKTLLHGEDGVCGGGGGERGGGGGGGCTGAGGG